MLRSELTALIDADDEARARVDAARREAQARLDESANARAEQRRAREADERARLEEELRQIAAAAEAEAAERRARRDAWLSQRERAAEARFDEAVAAFLRIVLEGAAP